MHPGRESPSSTGAAWHGSAAIGVIGPFVIAIGYAVAIAVTVAAVGDAIAVAIPAAALHFPAAIVLHPLRLAVLVAGPGLYPVAWHPAVAVATPLPMALSNIDISEPTRSRGNR